MSRRLAERGQRVTVVVLVRDAPHTLLAEVRDSGVEVAVAPFEQRDPRIVFWLARLMRKRRFDAVQSFLWRADARVTLASLLVGRRGIVCSERGERSNTGYSWY